MVAAPQTNKETEMGSNNDGYCAVHNHGLDARDDDDRATFYTLARFCTCDTDSELGNDDEDEE